MKSLNGDEQIKQIKASTCQHDKCKRQAVAYVIFARPEKGAQAYWKGYVCDVHFNKLHTKYMEKGG